VYDVPAPLTANGFRRTGYHFDGWNAAANGSGAPYSDRGMVQALTPVHEGTFNLYAQWVSDTTTVLLDAQGGAGGAPFVKVLYGDPMPTAAAPTRAGYTFNGYYSEPDGDGTGYYSASMGSGHSWDATSSLAMLYALWETRANTVTFDYHYDVEYRVGRPALTGADVAAVAAALPAPAKPGHAFLGWAATAEGLVLDLSTFGVVSDTTLHARWGAYSCAVHFNPNGGAGTMLNQTIPFDSTRALTAVAFTREGYDFTGWHTKANGKNGLAFADGEALKNTIAQADSMVTLYAQWNALSYTLTFEAGDGATVAPTTKGVQYDSVVNVLPTPTRGGWGFNGWYTGEDGAGVAYTSGLVYRTAGNTTLYAMWLEHRFVVDFDGAGGVGSFAPVATGSGNLVTQPSDPMREGYTFVRWYSVKTVDDQPVQEEWLFATAQVSQDTVLHAEWRENHYSLTYASNNGADETIAAGPYAYTEEVTLADNSFTLSGYAFAGWNTEADGDGASYLAGATTTGLSAGDDATITLYAQWQGEPQTVTFSTGGGSAVASAEVPYNGRATQPYPNPTYVGYMFKGWFTVAADPAPADPSEEADRVDFTTYRVQGPVTFYARWAPNTFTVHYAANGGTAVADETVGYGGALDPDETTREGYRFAGWYANSLLSGNAVNLGEFTVTSPLTLFAAWTANTYSVAYSSPDEAEGATATSHHTYNVMQALTANGFTRAGQTFAGWATTAEASAEAAYVNREPVINLTANHEGTVRLYARWSPLTTTVLLDPQGGAGGTPNVAVGYGEEMPAAVAPTRRGYDFAGYYDAVSGGTRYYAIDMGSAHGWDKLASLATLYARWTPHVSNKLAFDLHGGSGASDTLYVTSGAPLAPIADPTKEGYRFGGWATTAAGAKLDLTAFHVVSDTTLHALWEAHTYAIHFDANGGQGNMFDLPMAFGQPKNLTPVGFTRAGYAFDGWNTQANGRGDPYAEGAEAPNFAAQQDGVLVLYAQWSVRGYTLTFDPAGGAVDVATKQVAYDEAVGDLPLPTRGGWGFNGWYSGVDGDGTRYTSALLYRNAGDLTLYAYWLFNHFTVNFDAHGGVGDFTPLAIRSGERAPEPSAPTKAGYTFVQWCADAGLLTPWVFATSTIASDITLHAAWRANTYRVAYHANDGEGSMGNTVGCEYDSDFALPANTFTREGYHFAGWNTAADGSGKVFGAGATASNLTVEDGGVADLYAQWEGDLKTVRFEADGGSAVASAQAPYNGHVAQPLANPTRSGYTFKGWFVSAAAPAPANPAEDGERVNFGTFTVKSDTAIYARWASHMFTVAFATNGGTPVADTLVEYGGKMLPPATTQEGYRFAGWYLNHTLTTEVNLEAYTVTAPLTLFAAWTANTYDVVYHGSGGADTTATSHHTYSVMQALSPNGFTRAGFSFAGWATAAGSLEVAYTDGAQAINLTAEHEGTAHLYAVWALSSTTVLLDWQGGAGGTESVVAGYGNPMPAATAPTRRGYDFEGYYDATAGGVGYYAGPAMTSVRAWDKLAPLAALYARWLPHTSNLLSFDYHGGVGYDEPRFVTSSAPLAPVADPTREGYRFDGWAGISGGPRVDLDAFTVVSDTTLHARWLVNEYSIRFNPNEGQGSMPDKRVKYGETALLPQSSFTRTGYDFAGWNTRADGKGAPFANGAQVHNLTAKHDSVILLLAQWAAKSYTLTLNPGAGTVSPTTKLVKYDSAVGELPTPQRAGHGFNGWYSGQNGAGTAYTSALVYRNSGNTTLYASWIDGYHTVDFSTNGGVGNFTSQAVAPNGLVPQPEAPTKTGYTFGGWYADQLLTEPWDFATSRVNSDITIYAKWQAHTYSLTYHANGGVGADVVEPSKEYDREFALTPNAFTRAGYDFAAWSTAADGSGDRYANGATVRNLAAVAGGAAHLYAQWVGKRMRVDFNTGGGTAVASVEVPYDGKVTQPYPNPTYPGHVFRGWFVSAKEEAEQVNFSQFTVVSDTTIYAQWAANTFRVVFAANGGTDVADTTVAYGGTLGTRPPTREGYQFAGWHDNSALSGAALDLATFTVTSPQTLFAAWAPNTYYVAYLPNGEAGGSMPLARHTYNAPQALAQNGYYRTGYTFAAWDTEADGGGVRYTAGQEVSNLTVVHEDTVRLYAQWEGKRYGLYFFREGGAGGLDSLRVAYGAAVGELPVVTRTGYTFGGWWTNPDSGGEQYVAATVYAKADSTHLYARWSPARFRITFNAQGGAVSRAEQNIYYRTLIDSLPTATREDYIFVGWFTEADGGSEYTTTTVYPSPSNATLYARWVGIDHTSLTNITVGGGGRLTPAFDPAVRYYTLTLPCNDAEIALAYNMETCVVTANGHFVSSSVYPIRFHQLADRDTLHLEVRNAAMEVAAYHIAVHADVPDLLRLLWGNRLLVNLDPATNGGYALAGSRYRWSRTVTVGGVAETSLLAEAEAPYLTLEPMASASYSVQLVSAKGDTVFTCPIAISVGEASPLSVYPNPASTQLTVQGAAVKAGERIGLYEASGRLVRRYVAPADRQAPVSLVGLPPGIYIVRAGGEAVSIVVVK
jgi:uncharacterized repeat protein (TIGR02543 family)